MRGNATHNGLRRAFEVCAKHWVWSAMAALLILVGFILWTGITWSHLGVLAQFLVAGIALGGYVFSYRLYREQEAHKYRPALVATFPVPAREKRASEHVGGWMPGFVCRIEESNEVLDATLFLDNISESPVTDVRLNFYSHDCERLSESPGKPQRFFEKDILLVDGIAKSARESFSEILRPHLIREVDDPAMNRLAGGGKMRAYDFSTLFVSLIASETRKEPARLSTWSLVLKYKNLQGEVFFSVYKLEGPVVPVGSLQPEEYFRMAFYGSFSGDYLEDDEHHHFVINRGFPNAEVAPDWQRIKTLLQERAATAVMTPAILNPPSSF